MNSKKDYEMKAVPAEMDNKEKKVAVESEVKLRRELGLVGATSFVVGIIIGSGIFISPKGVLRATGSVGLCLTVWALAGILELGNALCFSELGSTIHTNGGHYTYLRMGIGNPIAFAYMIVRVLIITPSTLCIVLLTFAKYLMTLLPICGSPVYLEKFIAAAALVTLAIVNSYSSRLAARVTILTTFGKVSALIAIIIGGIIAMSNGTTSELGTGFSGTSDDPSSLALALYSASFSYGGGESLTIIVEEIKKPAKTVPKAIIMSVFIVIVIYMLTNVSYLAVMTRGELLRAEAVAVLFGDRALGVIAKLIPVAVMVSTFGAANNMMFGGTRITYAAAKDNNVPDVLCYLHINQLTPQAAMVVTVTMGLILLIPGDAALFINYIGFLAAFYNSLVYISFLVFRLKTMKDVQRTIKIPLIIPILMLVFNIYLFVAPLVITPDLQYVYVALIVFGTAAVLYIPFIHFRLCPPFYDQLVAWLQCTFQMAPPSKVLD